MRSLWKKIKNTALETAFPAECFFCKKPGTFLCADCQELADIAPVHRLGHSLKYLEDIYAAGSYDNKYLKKIIGSFKYEPFHQALGFPLARLIANHFELSQTRIDPAAVLIAVPLARKRLRWRGFNQAQVIAQNLSSLWHIPVSQNSLTRSRETQIQAELTGRLRQENIKGAFLCPDASQIKGKTAYLVDDVVTTGATMNECAKTLRRQGAKQVIGIAIARAEN
jgi:ComF family protein